MHARGLQRSGDRRRISHAPDPLQRYELEARDPQPLHDLTDAIAEGRISETELRALWGDR